jgi:peptidoglycan/xylan/chitin deacetylase (PgdA/CDA1 family)
MSHLKAALRPAYRRLRRLAPRRTGPAILMYHRIADETFDPWGMAVSPENFEEQADWLARNRKVLPLTEFAAVQREGKLQDDAVAITFDDGYACTFNTAEPILGRFGLAATVFLPAASIQRGGEFWWDELERLVLGFDGACLTLDGHDVKLGLRAEDDRQWKPFQPPRTARQSAFRKLWSIIRRKRGVEVENTMADLRCQVGETPPARHSHRIATADEVKASSLEGGCHGLTHASLTLLSRPERIREIEDGKALLAELTGSASATFGYPFGDVNSDVRRIVESAGFLCACGSRQTFVRKRADLFALPRLVVENDSAGLSWMLSGR